MTMAKQINYIGLAIILSLVVALDIWAFMMPLDLRFGNYDSFTHSLGQLTGLAGTILFAWVFVLTTKLKLVENSFGGLDRVYRMHHLLGVASFVMLLFHPLLLVVKFIPNNIHQAALYLWPSASWAVNYGIISLLAMILLIVLTFYINLKYGVWKSYHRLMGIVFVIACFHIFLVTTDLSRSFALRSWMIFICAIGLISHIYGSYLKNFIKKEYEYVVGSIAEKENIKIITLAPKSDYLYFEPGQFIFIKFKDKNFNESHPFTIASKPGRKITLCIKSLGDFTYSLKDLKVGTKALIDGPYGRFYALNDPRDQIWIAGGIGITPFLSFLESLADQKKAKRADLFYCVKNERDAVFLEKLNQLAKNIPGLKIIACFSDKEGYLDVNKIKTLTSLKNKSVYLCCPSAMLLGLKSQLKEAGLGRSAIKTEEFSIL